MVTTVENLHDMHVQCSMCACYVVKKIWRGEDVIVATLKAIFRLQREPNVKSGRTGTAGRGWQPYLQELRDESCCEGQQHIQFTQQSPSTVQRMQGKQTSSSGA